MIKIVSGVYVFFFYKEEKMNFTKNEFSFLFFLWLLLCILKSDLYKIICHMFLLIKNMFLYMIGIG